MPRIIYSSDDSDEESKDVDVEAKEEATSVVVEKVEDEPSDAVAGPSNPNAGLADVDQRNKGVMVINLSDFDNEKLRMALELLEQARISDSRQSKISDTKISDASASKTPSTTKSIKSIEVEKKKERSSSSSNSHKSKVKKEEDKKKSLKKEEEKKKSLKKQASSKIERTDEHKTKVKHKTSQMTKKDGVKVVNNSVCAAPRHSDNSEKITKKKEGTSVSKPLSNTPSCSKQVETDDKPVETLVEVRSETTEVKFNKIDEKERQNDFASDDDWDVDVSRLCDTILDVEPEKSANVVSLSTVQECAIEFDVRKSVDSLSEQTKVIETLRQMCSAKMEQMARSKDESSSFEMNTESSTIVAVSPLDEISRDTDGVALIESKRSNERLSVESSEMKDSKEVTSVMTKVCKDINASSSKEHLLSVQKKRDRHKHSSSKSSKLIKNRNRDHTISSPPSKLTMKDDDSDIVVSAPIHRLTDLEISRDWRAKDEKLRMTSCVVIQKMHPKVLHRLQKYKYVKVGSKEKNERRDDYRLSEMKGKEGKEKERPQDKRTETVKVREERTETTKSREEQSEKAKVQNQRVEKVKVREEKTEKVKTHDQRTAKVKVRERPEKNEREKTEKNDRERTEKNDRERTEKNEREERTKKAALEEKMDEEVTQEERTEDEKILEKRTEGESTQNQSTETPEKEGVKDERLETERPRKESTEKERLQGKRTEKEVVQSDITEKEKLRDNRLEADRQNGEKKPDKERRQVERRLNQEETRRKHKRPWRNTTSVDKQEQLTSSQEIKKRRIVRPFKHDTKAAVQRKPTSPQKTIEENDPQDMFSSFEQCAAMKEDIPGDFLMNGIETDAMDSTVPALGDDDEVLLQARQVGQPTTDFSQLLNCSVGVTDVPKTMDFEDCISGEDMLSSWHNDTSPSPVVVEVNSRTRTKQEADIMLSEESSMKEYESYLDDCDFRGEMPTEKIDKSSDPCPDVLTPKKQLEELKVQINGVVASFVNHSPVKLSPHNVMLSSSVCDVVSPVTNFKDVEASVGEDIDAVPSTSKMGNLLLPNADVDQANSNASVDSKSNLVSAPFAMTTDLDVAELPVEVQNCSANVDMKSENSYSSQCSNNSIQKETVFASHFSRSTNEDRKNKNNVNPTSEMDLVWNFKKVEEVITKQPNETSTSAMKTPKKHPRSNVQQKERKPVSSLSLRIAKELGTEVADDDDVISIMAPSSDDDFLLNESLAEDVPSNTMNEVVASSYDNSSASFSTSEIRQSCQPSNSRLTSTSKTNGQNLLLDLQRMKSTDLLARFERDVRTGNHKMAIKIFNVLQSKVIEPLKYNMISNLLKAIVNMERMLDVDLVNELFQTVVKLVPSYEGNICSQIQILRFMFSIFKKSQHLPSSVHNYTRSSENDRGAPGIVQMYNQVLRNAIHFENAEMLHLYRDATEVGIEIEETSLRSLLIVFQNYRLTSFAMELYNLGCCMGIYPRIRIREWPHCLRLKTFYSENELEILIRDFFNKLAFNLRSNPRFYEPRAITNDEKFTVYLYIEELLYQKEDKGGVLEGIDCSLSAAVGRVANVLISKIDKTLRPHILKQKDDRLLSIKAAGTIHLMMLSTDACKKKSSHSSINFHQTISESSIEANPFKTET